jgi:hypothetical protein
MYEGLSFKKPLQISRGVHPCIFAGGVSPLTTKEKRFSKSGHVFSYIHVNIMTSGKQNGRNKEYQQQPTI